MIYDYKIGDKVRLLKYYSHNAIQCKLIGKIATIIVIRKNKNYVVLSFKYKDDRWSYKDFCIRLDNDTSKIEKVNSVNVQKLIKKYTKG